MSTIRIAVERFTEAFDKLADATLYAGASLAVFSQVVQRAEGWAHFHEEEEREYYEAQDRDIERELGPWPSRDGWTEETDIERVPLEIVEAWA